MDGIGRVELEMLAAGTEAAKVWAEHVLGQAQRLAPIAEGTLRASGFSEVHATPFGVEALIAFPLVYAAVQHEHVEFTHPTGGQAKYLESPFKAEIPRFAPLIAAAIRARMHGL